ncbi:hypothetical protein ACHRV6_08395 [Flavobacterium sp. FlaQc-51]|uniref:hypothetical protein n=1 Tax=Flavobacterium sp. FlaQc-51 TaxID=3374184 RepID=UPI0037563902
MINKNLTFNDLNLQFYDALNQIFVINKNQTWSDLSKRITLDKISETYKVFGEIFPPNLDRYALLPKNDAKEKLTSIFHGVLDGKSIINNIARYSLYSDEIIVFHPLQNPNLTSPEYSPILKPNLWKSEFVNALYFYIVLQKWVKKGLIHLIESPFSFELETFEMFRDLASKRVNETEDIFKDPSVKAEHDAMMYEKLRTSILGLPSEAIEQTLKKALPHYSNSQIKNTALEMKEHRKTQPLYVEFQDDKEGELIVNKSGGNIEMIESLCRLTGAHSYTTQHVIKKQLELRGTNPFWTKFGTLYSGLNMTYLDNVDTTFALNMREEERISGVRKSFRELSSFLEQTELDKLTEDKILHFSDKFNFEVKKSEEEWMKIITDAKKVNAMAVTGSATIGAIIDPTKIILPAIGIPSSIAIVEYFKKRGLKSYRAKDPYSVFVDLKNNKPSFFSEFKNCIM